MQKIEAVLCGRVRLLFPSLKVPLHNANIRSWSHSKPSLASTFLTPIIGQKLRCWGGGEEEKIEGCSLIRRGKRLGEGSK